MVGTICYSLHGGYFAKRAAGHRVSSSKNICREEEVMKSCRYLLLMLLLVMMTGCKKQEEETVPLVSEMVTDEEVKPEVPVMKGALKDIGFLVQGQEIKLPLKYQEAIAAGWIFKGNEEDMIDARSYRENQEFELEGQVIITQMTNFLTEQMSIKECFVGAAVIDMAQIAEGSETISVTLPEGISMLESTIVQVEEAYGDPTDRYEGEDKLMLTYEFGLNKRVILVFAPKTEKLNRIEFYNLENPEEENEEKVSKEPSEAIREYQEPEVIAEDFGVCTISYDQALYRVPAPVKAFTDKGWAVLKEQSDEVIKPGEFGSAALSKDGRNLYTIVYNPGEEVTVVDNCFVTILYADLAVTKVPAKIAKGITLGMSREDCLTALGDAEYEEQTDEKLNTVTYYIYHDEEKMCYTSITIDNALQLVSGIKVVNYPEGISKEGNSISEAAKNLEMAMKGM